MGCRTLDKRLLPYVEIPKPDFTRIPYVSNLARDAAGLRVKGDRSTPAFDIVQEKRTAR